MSAINTLRNDKDAIISIVSEHFIMGEDEISELQFRPFGNCEHKRVNGCKVINHGEWIFCYHRDVGTLYIK